MRHARTFSLIGLAALTAGAVALAQTAVEPLAETQAVEIVELDAFDSVKELAETRPGDADAGAAKATLCSACHGMDGNPMDGMPYPRIAGQSERFIAHQLALFKAGQRTTGLAPAMVPFTLDLSAQDMRDLGAFFETQTSGAGIADDSPVADGPYRDMPFYQVGETLYRRGDAARAIPACMACHGPSGAGNPGPAYPRVSGQEAAYVERRLHEYRTGLPEAEDARQFAIMATVAASLSDQEIAALASYLQGLHTAPDAATQAAIAQAGQ